MSRLTLLTIACSLILVSAASADPIQGLYSTGQGLMPGQTDTNYVAQGSYGSTVVSPYTTYYHPGLNDNGQWISPQASGTTPVTVDPGPNGGNATYTYNLVFDLTGLNPNTAQITGKIAADNAVDVRLNGSLVYALTGDNVANFGQLYDLVISSHFVSGQNTLSFAVTNVGGVSYNPAALLVTGLSGTAAPSHHPEPASLLAWGLIVGMGGLGYRLRKRKQQVVA